jgi:hypothetical protein
MHAAFQVLAPPAALTATAFGVSEADISILWAIATGIGAWAAVMALGWRQRN